MIEYFIFRAACNTLETGSVYPQVQKMSPEYDYDSANSVHNLSRETDNIPYFEPNLDYFIVSGKAKLTDLLSVSVMHGGFLISQKLKNLFEQHKLPLHKFYPAKVNFKKEFFQYYWIHIISKFDYFVDFSKSSFFVYYNFSKNLGCIDISSQEELIAKEQRLKNTNPGKTIAIWAETIVLKSSFDSSLDLFKIGN